MKLGIVIPLKSKAASRNWNVTCQSLKLTIQSIIGQTSQEFYAIIVGHDKPGILDGIDLDKFNIEFIELEIPPPHNRPDEFTQEDYTRDKNAKIVRGMQELASKYHIDYWYALDADDLISKNFVEYFQSCDIGAGCILEGGDIIFKRRKRYIPYSKMSLICGSTSILADYVVKIPDKLDGNFGGVAWTRYSHTDMEAFFKNELKQPYKRIYHRLVGYVLDHGDNCSDGYRQSLVAKIKFWIKPYLLGKKLDAKLKEKYSLSQIE